jgi:hypothetical protein
MDRNISQNGIDRMIKKNTLTEVRSFRQSGLLNPTTFKVERNNDAKLIASSNILPR